jgi:hypothetical protein
MLPTRTQSKNFIISPSNNKVMYIYSDLFQKMPITLKYIRNLSRESCGVELGNLCQQNPCNTSLVIYLNYDGYNITPPNIENGGLYQYILGFLTVELYPGYGEIYNVCTLKEARGKGVMTSIFRSLLKDVPREKIWLGIDLKNPSLYDVLRLYVSVGFKESQIQYITPAGKFPTFPFLSLTYIKGDSIYPSDSDVATEVNRGRGLIENYKQTGGGLCTIKTYIKPNLISGIRDNYIGEKVEYGGIMGATRENNMYILGLAAPLRGSEKTFTVDIKPYYITWHTHPYICYHNDRCYIGWPSGRDMALLLRLYIQGMLAHFLYTLEGVYFIQLHPTMMQYLKLLPRSCIDDISTIVEYYFGHLEEFRKVEYDDERLKCLKFADPTLCLTYDSSKKHSSIGTMMDTINNTTLYELLNRHSSNPETEQILKRSRACVDSDAVKRFPIFRGRYTPMSQALKEGIYTNIEYLIAPTNPACPIKEYKGQDINYG